MILLWMVSSSCQLPVALDRVDPDFPLCRDGEDFHAVEHGTSDPGQLADDQDIIGPEPVQYSRDLSVAPGRSAGCRFLDKLDTTEILFVGEGKDFGAVLFQILGACGDPQIADGSVRFSGHWITPFRDYSIKVPFSQIYAIIWRRQSSGFRAALSGVETIVFVNLPELEHQCPECTY